MHARRSPPTRGRQPAAKPSPPVQADAPRRRALRPILFRVLGVLLGLVAAGVGLELALRVTGFTPPKLLTKRVLIDDNSQGRLSYSCYTSNPNGELGPVPDTKVGKWRLINSMLPPKPVELSKLSETPFCVQYSMSEAGIRDRDYSILTPPGVLRMAIVGDSFVFGEGVPLEKTLFRQIEGNLGANYQCIDLAWPGFNTKNELDVTKQSMPNFGFNRILLVFIANDIELTPELNNRQKFINDLINVRDQHLEAHQAQQWYAGRSQLLRLLGGVWDMRRVTNQTIGWYQDMYEPLHNADNLNKLASYFEQFAQLSDAQVAVVLYPLLEGLEGEYPLARVHERVGDMARRAKLPVLDLAPVFTGQRTRDLWVHETDHHPNGRAQGMAASAVVDWLRRDLPAFIEPPATTSAEPANPGS